MNLKDPRFRKPSIKLLNEIYEVYVEELNPSKKHYVVLDEAQIIEGWEKFVRFLHENKKVSVFVTGSNSKLLSSDYSSTLTGRHIDLHLFPLSFREYLNFRNLKTNNHMEIISSDMK